jgi:hypothetical protein
MHFADQITQGGHFKAPRENAKTGISVSLQPVSRTNQAPAYLVQIDLAERPRCLLRIFGMWTQAGFGVPCELPKTAMSPCEPD